LADVIDTGTAGIHAGVNASRIIIHPTMPIWQELSDVNSWGAFPGGGVNAGNKKTKITPVFVNASTFILLRAGCCLPGPLPGSTQRFQNSNVR